MIKTGSLSAEAGESIDAEYHKFHNNLKKLGDSSVTHIKYDGKHYLVDTGFANELDLRKKNKEFNKRTLKHDLSLKNLKFRDIEGIFITHWHADHFGNLSLFPNAKVYYYEPSNKININYFSKIYGFKSKLPGNRLKEKDSFAGCVLFPTEGHVNHHCSLIADYKSLKFCMAGDAIVSQSYYDKGAVWMYNSGNLGEDKCKESMKKIIEVADIIIPGHGHAFQNYKKKEF